MMAVTGVEVVDSEMEKGERGNGWKVGMVKSSGGAKWWSVGDFGSVATAKSCKILHNQHGGILGLHTAFHLAFPIRRARVYLIFMWPAIGLFRRQLGSSRPHRPSARQPVTCSGPPRLRCKSSQVQGGQLEAAMLHTQMCPMLLLTQTDAALCCFEATANGGKSWWAE